MVPRSQLARTEAQVKAQAREQLRRATTRRRKVEMDRAELLRDLRSAEWYVNQRERALDSIQDIRYDEAQDHQANISQFEHQLVVLQEQTTRQKRRAQDLEKDIQSKKRKLDSIDAQRTRDLWVAEVGWMQGSLDSFFQRREAMGDKPQLPDEGEEKQEELPDEGEEKQEELVDEEPDEKVSEVFMRSVGRVRTRDKDAYELIVEEVEREDSGEA